MMFLHTRDFIVEKLILERDGFMINHAHVTLKFVSVCVYFFVSAAKKRLYFTACLLETFCFCILIQVLYKYFSKKIVCK